jgi:basic membrane protein A
MPFANDYNKVGIIVGMDTFPMRQGILGFEAGARFVNPDVEVLVGVIGSFSDADLAREIALDMYAQGVDFIQSIGGAAGLGIHAAAREAGGYTFASGANSNFLEPEHIVATALRDVAGIVFGEISGLIGSTWDSGLHISGIAEGAVGYDRFQSHVAVPHEIMQVVRDIYNRIATGELVLPTTAEELESWLESNT